MQTFYLQECFFDKKKRISLPHKIFFFVGKTFTVESTVYSFFIEFTACWQAGFLQSQLQCWHGANVCKICTFLQNLLLAKLAPRCKLWQDCWNFFARLAKISATWFAKLRASEFARFGKIGTNIANIAPCKICTKLTTILLANTQRIADFVESSMESSLWDDMCDVYRWSLVDDICQTIHARPFRRDDLSRTDPNGCQAPFSDHLWLATHSRIESRYHGRNQPTCNHYAGCISWYN